MLLTSGQLECRFDKPIEKLRRAEKKIVQCPRTIENIKNFFFQESSALNCCYGHVEFSFDNTDRLFFHKTKNGFG